MKTFYIAASLLVMSTAALATTPAQYGQNTQDDWNRVKQEASLNKSPTPSQSAYEQKTQRDESSLEHNGGKVLHYDNDSRVYYKYSDSETSNTDNAPTKRLD